MDKILGKIKSLLNKDWTIILVSDHGFKGCDEYVWHDVAVDNLLDLLELEKKVYAIKLMERVFLRPRNNEIDPIQIVNKVNEVRCENGEPLFNVTYDMEHVEIWVNNPAVKNVGKVILSSHREYPVNKLILYDSIRSGTHDKEGVFIIKGPNIKSNTSLKNVSVYDVTPTILAIKNMSIPKDMDGRVLKEIFKEKSRQKYILSYEKESKITKNKIIQLGEEEEKNIQERLRELGYL